jgi:hypothetical protein
LDGADDSGLSWLHPACLHSACHPPTDAERRAKLICSPVTLKIAQQCEMLLNYRGRHLRNAGVGQILSNRQVVLFAATRRKKIPRAAGNRIPAQSKIIAILSR